MAGIERLTDKGAQAAIKLVAAAGKPKIIADGGGLLLEVRRDWRRVVAREWLPDWRANRITAWPSSPSPSGGGAAISPGTAPENCASASTCPASASDSAQAASASRRISATAASSCPSSISLRYRVGIRTSLRPPRQEQKPLG
jgi:hypothetical protein